MEKSTHLQFPLVCEGFLPLCPSISSNNLPFNQLVPSLILFSLLPFSNDNVLKVRTGVYQHPETSKLCTSQYSRQLKMVKDSRAILFKPSICQPMFVTFIIDIFQLLMVREAWPETMSVALALSLPNHLHCFHCFV